LPAALTVPLSVWPPLMMKLSMNLPEDADAARSVIVDQFDGRHGRASALRGR
jgi:hypothetical protein